MKRNMLIGTTKSGIAWVGLGGSCVNGDGGVVWAQIGGKEVSVGNCR